jgi:hypothetical protein
METNMKMIVAALSAAAFVAGATAPASAGEDVVEWIAGKVDRIGDYEVVDLAKARRAYVPRQIEYDFSKLPVGSAEWWRQRDRERGGRR